MQPGRALFAAAPVPDQTQDDSHAPSYAHSHTAVAACQEGWHPKPPLRRPQCWSAAQRRGLPLADYAVAQQHVADLETAGLICSLEPDHLGRPEVWSIVDQQSGNRFLIWRAGRVTVVDSYLPQLDARRRRHGMEAEIGQPIRCRRRSMDAAWNAVREWCSVPAASYAFEAGQAANVMAALPAWLTAS